MSLVGVSIRRYNYRFPHITYPYSSFNCSFLQQCIYEYMYVYIHVCIYLCAYVCMCFRALVRVYVCACIYLHVSLCLCVLLCVCAYTCMCMVVTTASFPYYLPCSLTHSLSDLSPSLRLSVPLSLIPSL